MADPATASLIEKVEPPQNNKCRVCAFVVAIAVVPITLLFVVVLIVPIENTVVVRQPDVCTRNYTEGDTCLVKIDTKVCSSVTLHIDTEQHKNASALLDIFPVEPKLSSENTIQTSYSDIIERRDYHLQWIIHLHPGSTLTVDACAMWTSSSCVPKPGKQQFALLIFRGKQKYNNFILTNNFDNTVNYTLYDITSSCQEHKIRYNYTENGEYYHVITKVAPSSCEVRATANVTILQTQYSYSGTERPFYCRVDLLEGTSCSHLVDGRQNVLAKAYEISESANMNLDEKVYLTLSCSPNHRVFAAIAVPIIAVALVIYVSIAIAFFCKQLYDDKNKNKREIQ